MYYTNRIVATVILAPLAAAAWWSIQLARADYAFRQQTPESVDRAIALTPTNTAYLAFAALQTEYAGDDPQPLLQRITQLNPTLSAPHIRLGLAAELRGDLVEAEHQLQAAYQVDHQFEPRWTLANFYLRQQRWNDFWTWIRSALEIQTGDRRPVFDLLWRVSSDAPEILARAIPADPQSLSAYLSYVLNAPHLEAAMPAALELLNSEALTASKPAPPVKSGTNYRELLNATCTILVDTGRTSEALQVWQSLGAATPSGITNPDLQESSQQAFDWRYAASPDITHLHLDQGGHRIKFDGSQPESGELLRQMVGGLHPGTTYRLTWQSRTMDLLANTGIEWHIAGTTGKITASDSLQSGELLFQAQHDAEPLLLLYSRPSGQTRATGNLDLMHVETEPRP